MQIKARVECERRFFFSLSFSANLCLFSTLYPLTSPSAHPALSQSFGAFGVALIAAHAAAPLCSAAAELVALRWWVRAAAAERRRATAEATRGAEPVLVFKRPPYSSIRHMKPTNKVCAQKVHSSQKIVMSCSRTTIV